MRAQPKKFGVVALVLLLLAMGLPSVCQTAHGLPWEPTLDFMDITVDLSGTPESVSYWRGPAESYDVYNWLDNNTDVADDFNDWVIEVESLSTAALWTDTVWVAYAFSHFEPNFTADKLILLEQYITINDALDFLVTAVPDLTPERNQTLNLATLAYARGMISLASEMSKHTFREITPTERVSMYREFTQSYKSLIFDLASYYKLGTLPWSTKAATVPDRLVSDSVKDEVAILNNNGQELDGTKRGRDWTFYYNSADEVGVGLALAGGFLINRDLYLYKVAWLGYLLRGELVINVLDSGGAPLANVLVTASHTQHDYKVSGVTDATGMIKWTVPRGVYDVSMEKAGYHDTNSDDKVTFLTQTESTYTMEEEPASYWWLDWQYLLIGIGVGAALTIFTVLVLKNPRIQKWYKGTRKRKKGKGKKGKGKKKAAKKK